jgi:hypothetical protein
VRLGRASCKRISYALQAAIKRRNGQATEQIDESDTLCPREEHILYALGKLLHKNLQRAEQHVFCIEGGSALPAGQWEDVFRFSIEATCDLADGPTRLLNFAISDR